MSSVGLKAGAAEMVSAQLVGHDQEDVYRPATLAADGGMDDGDAPCNYPLGDGSPALRRRRGGRHASPTGAHATADRRSILFALALANCLEVTGRFHSEGSAQPALMTVP